VATYAARVTSWYGCSWSTCTTAGAAGESEILSATALHSTQSLAASALRCWWVAAVETRRTKLNAANSATHSCQPLRASEGVAARGRDNFVLLGDMQEGIGEASFVFLLLDNNKHARYLPDWH
jgi:hypothetical protein